MTSPHPRVCALIPAHNEEQRIEPALQSLFAQTRPPDRIVVIADNCTDATATMVRARFGASVEVRELFDNRARKAGALNAAMKTVDDTEFVVTLDADTVLDRDFIAEALDEMRRDASIGGVGGRCMPQPMQPGRKRLARLLWRAQCHEYAREDSTRIERRGAVDVMPGAAMMIRCTALVDAGLWTVDSVVEDYHLSIQMRRRGWRTRVGFGCFCLTEVPDTPRALWRQRRRWYGGVINELRRFGAHDACRMARNQYQLNNFGLLGSFVGLALLFAWPLGLAPFPLGTTIVPVFTIATVDRIVRLRYLPHRTLRDVAWVLSPLADLFILFRQAVWLTSIVAPPKSRW